jgi:hypothetical protein
VKQREREVGEGRRGEEGGIVERGKKRWMMYVDYGQVIDINLAASKTVKTDKHSQSSDAKRFSFVCSDAPVVPV